MKVIVMFCYACGQVQDGIRNRDDNEKDETLARDIKISSTVQVKSCMHNVPACNLIKHCAKIRLKGMKYGIK